MRQNKLQLDLCKENLLVIDEKENLDILEVIVNFLTVERKTSMKLVNNTQK